MPTEALGAVERRELMVDLTGWDYVLTFGYTLDLYARGTARIAVDRRSGRVVLRYTKS